MGTCVWKRCLHSYTRDRRYKSSQTLHKMSFPHTKNPYIKVLINTLVINKFYSNTTYKKYDEGGRCRTLRNRISGHNQDILQIRTYIGTLLKNRNFPPKSGQHFLLYVGQSAGICLLSK